MQSARRKAAERELGLSTQQDAVVLESAISKEEARRERAYRKRRDLEENSMSYRSVKGLARLMDDFFLDPILGFFLPGIGDILTTLFCWPFIYVSIVKIKSIPLTLAVINNMLVDMFLGMIPFVGDILDVFHKAFKKNYRLIVGYIEDDKEIIQQVNKKAFWTLVSIAVMCIAIYYLFQLVKYTAIMVWDFFTYIFDFIVGMF